MKSWAWNLTAPQPRDVIRQRVLLARAAFLAERLPRDLHMIEIERVY